MNCTFCNADNAEGAKFCKACGKPLAVTPTETRTPCPKCSAMNDPSALFCKSCGHSLAAEQPSSSLPAVPVDDDATLLHVTPAPVAPPQESVEQVQAPVEQVQEPVQQAQEPASVKPDDSLEPQETALAPKETPPEVKPSSRAGLWIVLFLLLFLFAAAAAGGGAWYYFVYKKVEASMPVLEAPKESTGMYDQSASDEPSNAREEEISVSEKTYPPNSQVGTQPEAVKEAVKEEMVDVQPTEPISTSPQKAEALPKVKEKPVVRRAPPVRREVREPQPAQPVVVPPPPPPSQPSWLLDLRGELGRCAAKNPIGKSICEDRARNRYCPGNWNRVRECVPVRQQPEQMTY